MTCYSVLDVTPTREDWISDYVGPANKLVALHGGQYLARTSSHEQIEGEGSNPDLRIIIQWPSKQAALDFMKDPEYAPHFEARTQGSISNHYLIEGKDEMA